MVCKDDMFAWFGHLSGCGRIEVVHGLLNMCMPLELRFAGTCVEFLARKDFRYLKEHELKANSAVETGKLLQADWVQDPGARHRMTVCLALLGSASSAASKCLYDALTLNETEESLWEKLRVAADANVRAEVLLMFTLALCHPAFTFAQKEEIAVRLKVIQSIADRLDAKVQDEHRGSGRKCEAEEATRGGLGGDGEGPTNYSNGHPTNSAGYKVTVCLEDAVREAASGNLPPQPAETSAAPNRPQSIGPKATPSPNQQTAQPGKSHIKNLDLKRMPKQKKDKKVVEYKIQVTWSGGEVTDVIKSQLELSNFHQELIRSFAEDGISHRQERSIPYFPGPRLSRGEASAEEGMSRLVDYLKQLMTKVPQHMLDSELVTSFFGGQIGAVKVPNGPNPSSSSSSSSSNASTCSTTNNLPSEVGVACHPLDERIVRDGVGGEGRVKAWTNKSHQLPGDSPMTRTANDCGKWKAPVASASSPTNFVHRSRPSPSSSPSPVQPAPGSYSVQEIFNLDRFVKESDRKELEPIFRNRTLEEIKSLSWEVLDEMNVKRALIPKVLKVSEKVRSSYPNGVVTHSDERFSPPHGNRRFPPQPPDWSQLTSGGTVYHCDPQVYMPNTPLDYVVQYSTQQRQGYGQPLSDSSEYSSPAASPALDRPGSRSDSDENPEAAEGDGGGGARNRTVHQAPLQQQQQPRHQQQGYPKAKAYLPVASNHVVMENANVALVHPQQLRGKGPIRGRSNSNSSQDAGRKAVNRPQTLGPLPLAQGPTRVENVPVEMGTMYAGPGTLTYSTVGYVQTAQGQGRSPAATPPLPQSTTSVALCTNCTCSCTTTTPQLSFSPSFLPFPLGGTTSVTAMFAGYNPALHGPSQPPPANGYLHAHQGIHSFAYPPPQAMPPEMMYSQAQFQPPGVMQQQMGSPSNGTGTGAPQVPGFLTGPTPNVGFHGPGGGGAYPQVHSQRAFGEHFASKKPSCYNCGMSGHFGGDCLEVTMEEVTNQGQYRLNLQQDPNELGEED